MYNTILSEKIENVKYKYKMKIAIVHDWLTNFAGAENCIQALCELYPSAPVYTSVYNKTKMFKVFDKTEIKTSFIQNLPFSKTKHQIYLILMPMAFENFDLSEFDIVISSSHACSKGVITKPETLHISYIYTPIRYFWSHYHEYKDNGQFLNLKKLILPPMTSYLRMWDKMAMDRPDTLACISKHVANRIEKYYRKKAKVIYPPVNTSKFQIAKNPSLDYFLMLGRLIPYKKFDLAIETFNKMGLPLKIVGMGSEYSKLKKMAKNNIEFLGYLPNEEIGKLYSNCQALIFPGEEDFGIVPLEVQASGRPVIAYEKGGATETVLEYKTGLFFREQNVSSLEETIISFKKREFIPERIRENALKFDVSNFKKNFSNFVSEEYKLFSSKQL